MNATWRRWPTRRKLLGRADIQNAEWPAAKDAYRWRKAIVEAPNAWIKHVLGFRSFSLRGLRKVAAERKLVCAAPKLTADELPRGIFKTKGPGSGPKQLATSTSSAVNKHWLTWKHPRLALQHQFSLFSSAAQTPRDHSLVLAMTATALVLMLWLPGFLPAPTPHFLGRTKLPHVLKLCPSQFSVG